MRRSASSVSLSTIGKQNGDLIRKAGTKLNRLGINFTRDAGLPAEEAFPLFSDLGFDAVFTEFFGTTALHEPYAEAAQRAGLYYECLHAPFGHINDIWSDGASGDRMEKELCDTVKAAAAFSVPYVVVHLSSGDHCPSINDTGHARFDRLIECAVRNHVTVAFENQRKLANLAFVMELYRDVPNVGFCWDVGHEKCFADGKEFVPLFGDRLVYTHIHDNLCEHNKDLHLIPFDGAIDYTRTAQHLKNFGGTLTLELLPLNSNRYTDISPRAYYTRAHDAAVRLRDLVSDARNSR